MAKWVTVKMLRRVPGDADKGPLLFFGIKVVLELQTLMLAEGLAPTTRGGSLEQVQSDPRGGVLEQSAPVLRSFGLAVAVNEHRRDAPRLRGRA